MIRIIGAEGRRCPTFHCDECGNAITKPGGFYTYLTGTEAEGAEVYSLCSVDCLSQFQDARGGRRPWAENSLDAVPVYLSTSMGVDPQNLFDRLMVS